jgi:small nuclear ribonucleoprotein (snRNP)-like protein
MLECIPYEFDKHINFILDCFEESWPGTNRTKKARYLDYKYFKHMDLNKNIVNMLE